MTEKNNFFLEYYHQSYPNQILEYRESIKYVSWTVFIFFHGQKGNRNFCFINVYHLDYITIFISDIE